jgi:lysophospholipase L1-like esterase
VRHRETTFRIVAVLLGVIAPIALFEGLGALAMSWDRQRHGAEMPADVRASVNREDHHLPTEPDPYLGFRLAPGISRERVRTNAWGLRGGPVAREPDAGTLRILFLGGSVVWGYEANSDEDTVPAFLERVLSRRADDVPALRGRRVEVLNAGVPAYVSWQEALAYAIHLRALSPHWVFALDAKNDIASAIINAEAGAPERYRVVRDAWFAPPPTPWQALVRWLFDGARDLRSVRALARLRPKSVEALGAPPPEEVAAEMTAAASFLSATARAEGARVVTVLQPMAILPDTKPLTAFEEDVVAEFEHRMPGRNADYAESYARMREQLATLALEREGAFRWIDATDAFADVPEPTYTDECHLTPLGKERLAERIADAWIASLESGDAS